MKKIVLFLALCLLSCNLASAQFPIDFSRVGYMWGEKPIPDHHVSITLSAPSDGDGKHCWKAIEVRAAELCCTTDCCIARKTSGRRYDDNLKRPDGVWESHGEHF